jgi:hypothetical protein
LAFEPRRKVVDDQKSVDARGVYCAGEDPVLLACQTLEERFDHFAAYTGANRSNSPPNA